jgi:hypothetical protein
VKRIEIVYGGQSYTISNRSYDDVRDEIEAALHSGKPAWLHVNSGEGRLTTSSLLITPGIPIALVMDRIDPVQDEAEGPLFEAEERRPGQIA